jgi:hypothetical protein
MDFVENCPGSLIELKALLCSGCRASRQEDTQRGPYTDGNVEFISTSIRFGKQLREDELKEIEEVVKARITAFDRDDAEMGYMTLFE